MTTKKKSGALRFLEELSGGPLTLGDALMSVRQGEEVSQAVFARKLGISRSHLCDVEKGRKSVSPDRAAKWARTLGYSEAQFVRLALQELVEQSGLAMKVYVDAA